MHALLFNGPQMLFPAELTAILNKWMQHDPEKRKEYVNDLKQGNIPTFESK